MKSTNIYRVQHLIQDSKQYEGDGLKIMRFPFCTNVPFHKPRIKELNSHIRLKIVLKM